MEREEKVDRELAEAAMVAVVVAGDGSYQWNTEV